MIMAGITRTYPTPDDERPHIGPRERAMAVFKYLLNLEPEVAIRDSRFSALVEMFQFGTADDMKTLFGNHPDWAKVELQAKRGIQITKERLQ